MREWRKLHSGILESRRFAELTDEAAVLFFLLISAQDDTGYYPWEPTKIKRLTVARDWSLDRTQTFAEELVQHGMAEWVDGGLMLRKGESLNGRPRKDIAALIYSRNESVTPRNDTATPRDESVSLEKSRIRVEKSRTLEVSNEPTKPSIWEPPDFYKPMVDLHGYTKRNHSKHAEMVRSVCEEAQVDPARVVFLFAQEYPQLRHQYGWSDPSAVLKKTPLAIAISKARGESNGRAQIGGTGTDTQNGIPNGYEQARIKRRRS
jgi:hypothetical protein